MKFGNEPLDLRLMLLYMLRKIRYVLYGVLLGALLFAGGYYLATETFAAPATYTAKGELYLAYADHIKLENIYINEHTWGELVHTDKAYEYAAEYIATPLEREYLDEVVNAGLYSDVRFVILEVTTLDPELSVEIAEAYMKSIMKFGKEMEDIEDITVYTAPTIARETLKDNRIFRVSLTGALLGLFGGIFFVAVLFFLDDSVLVPEDVKRRYGICVIAMLTKKDRQSMKTGSKFYFGSDILDETKKRIDWKRQFMKYYFRRQTAGCKHIAVMDIGSGNDTEVCMKALSELKELLAKEEADRIDHGEMKMEDAVYTSYEFQMEKVAGLHDDMSVVDRLHDYDGVILLIKAGEQNDKMIKSCTELLEYEKCNVLGAVVYDGDTALWNQYYFSPFNSNLKKIKNAEKENGAWNS